MASTPVAVTRGCRTQHIARERSAHASCLLTKQPAYRVTAAGDAVDFAGVPAAGAASAVSTDCPQIMRVVQIDRDSELVRHAPGYRYDRRDATPAQFSSPEPPS